MMTKILYYIFILPISKLPLNILYFFANTIHTINKSLSYRKEIVLSNLSQAFTRKSKQEIIKISDDFFKHLLYILFEIIKMISAKKIFFENNIKITNPEIIHDYHKQKQTTILVCGHFNNWEWAGQKIAITANQQVVSIYKPLNNKRFDNLIKKVRTKFGAIAISMEESMRYILNTKKTTKIICIIADQNPVINSTTKWHSFFGREVPVFMGIEKIAKKMNYPVLFCDMQKTENGKYTITFENLENNPKNTNEGEITKHYFERLEKQIKENPSQWLWSHKRWKHKK